MREKLETFKHILAQTTPEPVGIEIERGEGINLYGPNGEKYIDFISGISVSNVGHSAPEVVKAIQEQAAKYLHPMVYGEYLLEPQIAYAEKLLILLDDYFESIYFTNSGTEAIEGSMKLAKKLTGRQKIISCWNSYHGSTHGSLSLLGNDWMKEGYGPLLPNVQQIPFNDREALNQIDGETACIVIEALQGAGGMVTPDEGYLKAVSDRCKEVGALMILDEIQTGFGRTGSLFMHQTEDFVPDILVLAKALGAGLPVGAFITSQDRIKALRENPILGHITTYGGNPLSCVAGLASLNKILNENLISQIPAKEVILKERLQHPLIKTLRGRGLMYALIMEDFDQVAKLNKILLKNGLLSCFFINIKNGLRLAPPLIITEEEMHNCCDVILASLNEM
ncbi:MAG: aspartate aminotransferase family protein [Bacteroidota bacterium]